MSVSVRVRFGPMGVEPGDLPPAGLEPVAAAFPTVVLDLDEEAAMTIDTGRWRRGEVDLYELDYQVDELVAEEGEATVRVVGPGARQDVLEVLTRCQRWVGRRNRSSRSHTFDRVLALHRQLHDLHKPLVRADYDHALDVWQWMLRLCPQAGAAVQIAALFHDIERLVSEADARIEHRAAGDGGYDAFKHAHARGGAHMTYNLLGILDLAEPLRGRVARLIEHHEHRPAPGERDAAPDLLADVALLNDADGLSFFSLNSAGFLDYYGPAHTRRKLGWTLARLGPRARAYLPRIYLRPDVARLLDETAPGMRGLPGEPGIDPHMEPPDTQPDIQEEPS